MPVLGHAFMGLAAGMLTKPERAAHPSSRPLVSEIWLTITLVLAYLPDIVTQFIQFTGWRDARVMSHSVFFAVIASALIAPPLSRMSSVPLRRCFGISLFSILLHDLLDIAQSTDRLPLWPIPVHPVGFNIIPTDSFFEALLFGLVFVAFLCCRHLSVKHKPQRKTAPSIPLTNIRIIWVGRGTMAVIILAAVFTHYLRGIREYQLYDAHALLKQHDYPGILEKVELAEGWPSTAKPGRIDYLKALAYEGLGNRQQAEHYYLRSYRSDPGYFWCVVDLATFYASSPRPDSERRRLVSPYVNRLVSQFPGRKDLPGSLKKIERKLGEKNTP